MTNPSGTLPGPKPALDAATAPAPPRQRWRLYLSMPRAAVPAEPGRPAWPAIIAATGLPLAGDAGGRGRVSPAAPLPLGVAGEREVIDVYLTRRLPRAAVRQAVSGALPGGSSLVDLHDVWVGAPAAPAAVQGADYRAVVAGVARWALEGAVMALLAATSLPRERRREKKTTPYDLRPLLLRLQVRGAGANEVIVAMRLRHAPDGIGRPDEVLAALGEPPAPPLPGPLELRSLVRERLILADDPVADA